MVTPAIGGQVPDKPFEDDRRLSIRRAPTMEEVLEIIERVTEPSYHEPIFEDPRGSVAVYRQMARQNSALQAKVHRSQQASFFLPFPTQAGPPASSLNAATFEVVLRRTKDLEQGRIIEIGALEMAGDQGRRYVNAQRVEWYPYDPAPEKSVPMIAEVPGYFSNLDHLADPDTGDLVDHETGGPATSVLDLVDQGGRQTDGGSIFTVSGGLSQLRDSGAPDQLLASDVGLYVQFVSSTGNTGRIVKIASFTNGDVEEPFASGLYPNHVLLDDGPQRVALTWAHADDGGVFTDETAAARAHTVDGMTLLPAATAVGDAYYFAHTQTFGELDVDVSTAGVGDWALLWEYWDGSSWSALADVIDPSNGFRISGSSVVRFAVPVDWASTTVNSRDGYYVRARVDSVTTTTTQPLGRRASMFRASKLTADAGGVEWRVLDWREMGFEVVRMSAPDGGTDDMLRLLGEERGVYQQTNETDDAFRRRASRLADVVSPAAIQRAVNRELAEYGYRGLAIDVSNGMTGFFCDVDALDYPSYQRKFHVLLSNAEAYGWFFVFVPVVTDGTEFGCGWTDGGPEGLVGDSQLAPAWDVGVCDGEVQSADALYRSIYDAVDSRRMGGIGFTMIRTNDLNFDDCNPPPPPA